MANANHEHTPLQQGMRSILTLLLLTAAAPAWAEWVKVAETEKASFYIDPATIRKNGDLRRVWEVQDLKQKNSDGARSMRALEQYDCKEERNRSLALSEHSGQMATGNVIFSGSSSSDKWDYIAPNTIAEDILRILCAK